MLVPYLDTALEALSTATRQEQEGFKDAETRKLAVIALANLGETMVSSLTNEQVPILSNLIVIRAYSFFFKKKYRLMGF